MENNKMNAIGISVFEKIRHMSLEGNEYWLARELSQILEYSEFRHFLPVIEKAKQACRNSGQVIHSHFEDILEMVNIGSGAKREISDVKMSRYACYLIVQNSDPSKEVVAFGQTYFAAQTRAQELTQLSEYQHLRSEDEKRLFLRNEMKNHNKQLADAARNAGVVAPYDYAIFQDHGYKGLYGGLGAKDIHNRKGLSKNQQILDHMGSTELAANLFRATQTEEKLRKDKIKNKNHANFTHHEVGKKVRQTIKELGGTMPEHLPTHENIKESKKRLKKTTKQSLSKDI
jgi:DNA-damage-inducible protein D